MRLAVSASISENTHRQPSDAKHTPKARVPLVPVGLSFDARLNATVYTYRLETAAAQANGTYDGVRFAWIDQALRGLSENGTHVLYDWHLVGARLVCQTRPINYDQGRFAASDRSLAELWLVGAYTVRVALLEDAIASELMDRGDREQCAYGGYAQPILRTLYAVFGEYGLADLYLNRTVGWVHDSGILSYWLYWVDAVLDWVVRTAHLDTLFEVYAPTIAARLDEAIGWATTPNNGTARIPLTFFGDDERLGFEYEFPDELPEPQLAYRFVVLRTLRRVARVLEDPLVRDSAYADEAKTLATTYGAAADALERQLRHDHEPQLRDDDWLTTTRFGAHSAAEAASAGYFRNETAAAKERIVATIFGDPKTVPSWSAFNAYYQLLGLDALGATDAALALARATWGGNVAGGATCFWERFDPLWLPELLAGEAGAPPLGGINDIRTSECLAWSSGITAWLTESVLGVRPTSVGWRTWDAVPRYFFGETSTLTSVEGAVPTPLGRSAEARFDVRAGKHSIHVPAGTVARVGVPRMHAGLAAVSIDGVVAWQNETTVAAARGGVSQQRRASGGRRRPSSSPCGTEDDDARFLFCRVAAPGRHDIDVEYNDASAVVLDAGSRRRRRRRHSPRGGTTARFLGVDTATSGAAWIGRYGSRGYVVFGRVGDDEDRTANVRCFGRVESS